MDLFYLRCLNHNQVVDFFEKSEELKQFIPNIKQANLDGKDIFYLYDRMAGTDLWTQVFTDIGMTSNEFQKAVTECIQKSVPKPEEEGKLGSINHIIYLTVNFFCIKNIELLTNRQELSISLTHTRQIG